FSRSASFRVRWTPFVLSRDASAGFFVENRSKSAPRHWRSAILAVICDHRRPRTRARRFCRFQDAKAVMPLPRRAAED
ncbi:MAG: hypothetical protein V3R90_00540, partial [Limibaculum sp.]